MADRANSAIRMLAPDTGAVVGVTALAAWQGACVGLAVGTAHNVHVARHAALTVGRVSPAGVSVMVAGSGSQRFADGAPGMPASASCKAVDDTGTPPFH